MRIILVFLFLIHFTSNSVCQEHGKWRQGEEFKSVFQKLKSGHFNGTVNGLLIIHSPDGHKVILDFQGSPCELNIIRDTNEVYDVSTKSYSGKTTSCATEIKYETYALANEIGIKLNNIWYELSTLDGACDEVINGLGYSYETDEETEYLIIKINKDIELSNWQFLIRMEQKLEPDNIDKLKLKEKAIKLLPNSVLMFAIKRK
jgi:hypothetical protein